jgi:hypothetical protein
MRDWITISQPTMSQWQLAEPTWFAWARCIRRVCRVSQRGASGKGVGTTTGLTLRVLRVLRG